MRVLQINVCYKYGSTGRIAYQLMCNQKEHGIESAIIYGRRMNETLDENVTCIQSKSDFMISKWSTHIFGKHGFYSKKATRKTIRLIDEYKPDVIHLHNLHGHYIHVEMLINAIKERKIPVLWTFHDCWPFTGHCAYFHAVGCEKWKIGCNKCQLLSQYPRSLFFDRSSESWRDKKRIFNSLPNLKIITVSKWLEGLVRESFLQNQDIETIYNWVDCDVFRYEARADEIRNELGLKKNKVFLAVASTWTARKGIDDIIRLADMLNTNEMIVMVGDIGNRKLPSNIVNLSAVKDPKLLAAYYSMADVFINPSYQETFGLTTAEALACGTPAVVYDVSACPEVVGTNRLIGGVVACGDVPDLLSEARRLYSLSSEKQRKTAREWIEQSFSQKEQMNKYVQQYELLCQATSGTVE